MELQLTEKFQKKLLAKNQQRRAAVVETLLKLARNPHHPGLHVHKVKGSAQVFESYVNSSDRVTFHFGRDCLILRNCCEHDIIKSP